jgi:hypothetical protein
MLSALVAAAGMLNRSVAVEESKDIAARSASAAALTAGSRGPTFAGEQAVAATDAMQLPCAKWTSSALPDRPVELP